MLTRPSDGHIRRVSGHFEYSIDCGGALEGFKSLRVQCYPRTGSLTLPKQEPLAVELSPPIGDDKKQDSLVLPLETRALRYEASFVLGGKAWVEDEVVLAGSLLFGEHAKPLRIKVTEAPFEMFSWDVLLWDGHSFTERRLFGRFNRRLLQAGFVEERGVQFRQLVDAGVLPEVDQISQLRMSRRSEAYDFNFRFDAAIYVTSGYARYEIFRYDTFMVGPSCCLVIPADTPHSVRVTTGEPLEIIMVLGSKRTEQDFRVVELPPSVG